MHTTVSSTTTRALAPANVNVKLENKVEETDDMMQVQQQEEEELMEL